MAFGFKLGLGLSQRGGGAQAYLGTLHASNWLTADELHLDGVYWLRPYDLEAMGTPGQTLAAANKRYVWLASSDHHAGASGYRHGSGIWKGFSSDPGVLPTDWVRAIPDTVTTGEITGNHTQMETPWLVYNPDDATYPFYLYAHGQTPSDGGRGQETLVFKSADLVAFQTPTRSHLTTASAGHTGYQTVYRTGVNTWVSYGLGGISNNTGTISRWTSTDGLIFTKAADLDTVTDSGRKVDIQGGDLVTYESQLYAVVRDDDRTANDRMLVSFSPIEADGDLLPAANSDESLILPLSADFDGVSPGPGYVQSAMSYAEDGVMVYYVRRGYFADAGTDFTDLHTIVLDAAAAASAAPIGVRADCTAGNVAITWYDALPHRNYRVARSASASGPWTDLADVTGLSYTDSSPTADAINFYRVTTLNSGEQGSRIVSAYAGSHSALANRHILRALNAGAVIGEIDASWVATVSDWLDTEGLTDNVVSWTSPAFGVTYSAGSSVERIMDMAATIHPYKFRDALAVTTSSRYLATGVSGSIPGIGPNGSATARVVLSHGALNLLRQKTSVTLAAAFNPETTSDNTPLNYSVFDSGIRLQHNPANDRMVLLARGAGSAVSAYVAAPVTGDIFAAGTWEANGTLTAYCNGTVGIPAAANAITPASTGGRVVTGQIGEGAADVFHPAFGANTSMWRQSLDTYAFDGNAARIIWSDLMIFDVALTSTQLGNLNTLMQARFAT